MGCASSKLDDLPAVALCRERCGFLDQAIHQRFLLADAHVAYIRSLRSVGSSLCDFIEQDVNGGPTLLSPKLNLPPQRKGDPDEEKKSHLAAAAHHHVRSNSAGSHGHIQFTDGEDSDEGDDDDSDISPFHHSDDHSSPLHHHGGDEGGGRGRIEYMSSDYMNADQGLYSAGGGGGGFMHVNFMKSKATPPSVVYEQRPVSQENVYFGESSSSTSYYNYPRNDQYPTGNSSSYPSFGYSNYGGGGGGGAMTGYYGYSQPLFGSSTAPQQAASSPKPPPAPPSPPRASAWEFLNLFESGYDKFYPQYTPSRDSKELREEEGIPDLEDEDYPNEVVKGVHGGEKFVDGGDGGNYLKSAMVDDGEVKIGGSGEPQASLYNTRPSVENEGAEYEVHVVDKKVVDRDRSEVRSSGFKGGPLNPSQLAIEIKIQFERASECGNEIARMLEVGTVPYHRKHASSKMLQGLPPSLSVVSSQPSTSKSAEASSSGEGYLEIDEDLAIRSKNLSATLRKLYLWEKKLYNEVKAEEKLRVAHEKKCRKLKRLDERGAEAQKVHATQTLIRSLSTKIRMAIQVVDKISITINKIRDEELWPQLNDLIEGLTRMWKNMLDCHHNQCLAIREAKSFGPIGSGKRPSDAHLEATLQLERELLSWTSSFSCWVGAQKGYVRALNNWLVRCLLYEPEETADGPVPFSPGRLGAPPVFVICNQWAQAMDRISEKEVIQAMRIFAMSVLQLWEQDKMELQQRMMVNKDLERKVKNLDREDQKIQKEIQALDKRIVLVAGDGNDLSLTGNVVYQSDTKNNSLQGSLQRIFEAMERFVAESMKAYEELLQRTEEEKQARVQEGVS